MAVNNTYKTVILKNCAPFTSCIIEINSTQVDYAKDIDIVMPLYNLIECSNAFQRHQEVYGNTIDANNNIIDFPSDNNNSNSNLNSK